MQVDLEDDPLTKRLRELKLARSRGQRKDKVSFLNYSILII